MKYLPKTLVSLLAVSVLALPLLPGEANARTSFAVGVSSGPGYYGPYPHYGHHRRHHWRGHHHGHYARYYAPPPVYYAPPQPIYVSAPAPAQTANEPYCREYNRTIVVDGRKQRAYGNACLQEDGSWEITD